MIYSNLFLQQFGHAFAEHESFPNFLQLICRCEPHDCLDKELSLQETQSLLQSCIIGASREKKKNMLQNGYVIIEEHSKLRRNKRTMYTVKGHTIEKEKICIIASLKRLKKWATIFIRIVENTFKNCFVSVEKMKFGQPFGSILLRSRCSQFFISMVILGNFPLNNEHTNQISNIYKDCKMYP